MYVITLLVITYYHYWLDDNFLPFNWHSMYFFKIFSSQSYKKKKNTVYRYTGKSCLRSS